MLNKKEISYNIINIGRLELDLLKSQINLLKSKTMLSKTHYFLSKSKMM